LGGNTKKNVLEIVIGLVAEPQEHTSKKSAYVFFTI